MTGLYIISILCGLTGLVLGCVELVNIRRAERAEIRFRALQSKVQQSEVQKLKDEIANWEILHTSDRDLIGRQAKRIQQLWDIIGSEDIDAALEAEED